MIVNQLLSLLKNLTVTGSCLTPSHLTQVPGQQKINNCFPLFPLESAGVLMFADDIHLLE